MVVDHCGLCRELLKAVCFLKEDTNSAELL